MIARLGRDAIAYGVAIIVARGTIFLLVPILTRWLTPDEFGLVELGSVLIAFANVVVTLEIGQAMARFVPDEAHAQQRRVIASTALWFSLVAYAAISLGVLMVVVASGPIPQVLPSVMLAAIAGGVFLLVQGQLRWELRPVSYAIASFVFAGATVAATVILLVAGIGVPSVFLGQAMGAALGIVAVLLSAKGSFGREFDLGWLRTLLAFSGPLVPASLAVLVALYTDRFVIAAFLTLDDVARFSVGHRIASIVSLVMTAVQLAITPLIYASYRRPEAPIQIAATFRLTVGFALGLWVSISLLGPEVLAVVAPGDYRAAATVIPLLAPAIILSALGAFAPGLAIAGRTKAIAAISIFGAVLNVGLGLGLVPMFGIVGAGVATLTTAATTLVLTALLGQSHYRLPFDIGRIAVGVGSAAVTIALSGVVVDDPIPLAQRAILTIVTFALLAGFGLLRIPKSVSLAPSR